jgi:hypothetical protein
VLLVGFITLVNESDVAVSLNGWSLKALTSEAVFFFPDCELEAGGEVTVTMGKKAVKAKKGRKSFHWLAAAEEMFQGEGGDAMVVLDADGNEVSRVDIALVSE